MSYLERVFETAAEAVTIPNPLTLANATLNVATLGAVAFAGKITQRVETVTAVKTLTADDSGKTIFINHATGFAITLPAPAAGLWFKFIVNTPPTTGNHTIVTNGTTQKVLKGLIVCATHDDTGDSSAGGTTLTFVANQAVAGDCVEMICDGTVWYVLGHIKVAEALTITGE